jgi:hypothetical protein
MGQPCVHDVLGVEVDHFLESDRVDVDRLQLVVMRLAHVYQS